MTLTPEIAVALINAAVNLGIDAALALAKMFKGATIDDAINALQEAKTKTAQDYLNEAKAALPASTP